MITGFAKALNGNLRFNIVFWSILPRYPRKYINLGSDGSYVCQVIELSLELIIFGTLLYGQ